MLYVCFCNLAPNNEYLPIDYGEKRLTRSNNRMIGGVCAGIADYFEWDITLVRIIYVLATFLQLFRWTGLSDSLANHAGSQKRIIKEQACINRHTGCKYLSFPHAKHTFCGAETYVSHAGNVGFRLVKRKNLQAS